MARTYKQQSITALRRQVAGAVARENGRKFEQEIEDSCDYYRNQGIACIARNHPRVAGPPGRMWYAGKGEVDFVGHARGIPIAFDAKSVARDVRSWAYPPRDLHQVKFLMDWRNTSEFAVSFILLRQQDIAYIIYDLDTLYREESVVLREKQRPPKGGTELAESPAKLQQYIEWDGRWPFLEAIRVLP